MRTLVVVIDAEEGACGGCRYLKRSDRAGPPDFECGLFHIGLMRRLRVSEPAIALRCTGCLAAEANAARAEVSHG